MEQASFKRFIGKALKLRRDLIAIFTITLLLCIQTPAGIMSVNANAIASLIFQVAGTVVPLALTAAGLSSTFVIKLTTDLPDVFKENEKFPPHQRGKALISRINELEGVLEPAWWATLFVLVSFLLSALTLLIPADTFLISVSVVRVQLETFLASLSLAFILVGTLSFLPMVKYSFRGKVLTNLMNSAKRLRQEGVPTISEMLKDAREIRSKYPEDSYLQISSKLYQEYDGRSFPHAATVGLEAKDLFAPIEDSTSGLSEIKRGIDLSDWNQVCLGIMRLIEHEEAYQKHHTEQITKGKSWHNRRIGIETATAVLEKQIPDSLKKI